MNLDTTKYTTDYLRSLPINELRKVCKENGMKATGSKAKLVGALLSLPSLNDTESSNVKVAKPNDDTLAIWSRKLNQKEEEMDKLLAQMEGPIKSMLEMLQTEKDLQVERQNWLNQLVRGSKNTQSGDRRRSHIQEINELRSELEEKEEIISTKECENGSLSLALHEARELVEKYKLFTEGVINLRVKEVSKIQNTAVTSDVVMVSNLPWRVRFLPKNIPDQRGQTIKYAGVYLRCDLDSIPLDVAGDISCRARATFSLKCSGRSELTRKTIHNVYRLSTKTFGFATFVPWTHITDPEYGYNVNDEIEITTLIDVLLPEKFVKGRPVLSENSSRPVNENITLDMTDG